MIIKMAERCGVFAENKDVARNIRERFLKPALKTKAPLILDFEGVDSTTQSFIHALISGVIQTHGGSILDRLEFRSCSPAVKSLIATVVNYSME
jgi:hypothetical protein